MENSSVPALPAATSAGLAAGTSLQNQPSSTRFEQQTTALQQDALSSNGPPLTALGMCSDFDERLNCVPVQRDGAPFRPMEQMMLSHGTMQRVMPMNIYAAFILTWLSSPTVEFARILTIWQTLPALSVTIVLQVTFGMFLYGAVLDADGDLARTCDHSTVWLRWIALSAFTMLGLKELLDAWNMHLWLQLFPRSISHQPLELQNNLRASRAPGPGWERTKVSVHRPTMGIPRLARASFYAFAIIPNVASSVLVLIAGSGAVLRSANDFDLVINSVAAAFVLELDALVYTLLIPASTKALSQGLPPLNSVVGENKPLMFAMRVCVLGFYTVFQIAAVVMFDLFFYLGWCPWWHQTPIIGVNSSALSTNATQG